jgi:hypothetical protein
MAVTIQFHQALFHRPDRETPRLVTRSADFEATWIADAQHLIYGFGDRRGGVRCPLTVFAQPIGRKHVAVVRVMDDPAGSALRFHFLVVDRKSYEAYIGDPFVLAEKSPPTWDATGELPTLTLPAETFVPRTLAQVQEVLKRIKAAALREGEDPEAPDFVRTMENSESPALLGGVQILVDGGRLVFERPEGDLRMVSGLWLLLPARTRCRLWPTSFAFSQELEFDVLVVPHVEEVVLESYTTEEQAADYPQGTYEYALQHAAEQGTQADLDVVFSRRDSHHTIRLALLVLALVSALVLVSKFLDWSAPQPSQPLPVHVQQTATAAGIVAVGDPYTVLGMIVHAKTIWKAEEKKPGEK